MTQGSRFSFFNKSRSKVIYIELDLNDKDLLQYAISQGIIDLEDVRISMKEKEKQRLLSQHKYKIFKAEDGRWKTTLPDETKKSKRRLVAKTSEEDLINEIITFYSLKEDDKYFSLTDPTVADMYPEWINYRSTLTKSSSTIKRFKSIWNTWYKDKEISSIHLTELNYIYLNRWANSLVKDNNLDKKQYYLITSVFKQILDYSVEKKLIEENLFERVKVNKKMFTHKRKPKSDTQVFLVDEQKKVAETAQYKFESRPWCISPLMVLLNFQLGLRIGELVALKWEDIQENYISINKMETTTFIVDEDGNVIPDGFKVVPYVKSEAGFRNVYLNNIAKEILKKIKKVHLSGGYFDDGFLYIASRTKKRGTSRTFTKYLEDLCDCAGVVNKSNHKIRKTYISSLFDNGVNINTIREQAGHEDEKTSLNNYCFDQKNTSKKEYELEKAANQRMLI